MVIKALHPGTTIGVQVYESRAWPSGTEQLRYRISEKNTDQIRVINNV